MEVSAVGPLERPLEIRVLDWRDHQLSHLLCTVADEHIHVHFCIPIVQGTAFMEDIDSGISFSAEEAKIAVSKLKSVMVLP